MVGIQHVAVFQHSHAFAGVIHQQGVFVAGLADLFFHFGFGGNIFRNRQQTIRLALFGKHRGFNRVHNFYAFRGGGNKLLRNV